MGEPIIIIAGIIIAGGRGVRMGGGEKPLKPFAGATLLDAVIARARPQVTALALNPRPDAAPLYERFGLALVGDAYDGREGPMGGLVAGLDWAAGLPGCEALATFPGDAPFIPTGLVATLSAAGLPSAIWDGDHFESLSALWPVSCREALRAGVADGRFRSLWRALEGLGAAKVPPTGPAHAFFDVDTPEALEAANKLAGKP